MYKLLGDLKSYFKHQEITTDSMVFRLHNQFTAVLLFTCSMIISANQYVGNPISCIVQGLPTHPINTYCWITSTFTMPDAFNRRVSVDLEMIDTKMLHVVKKMFFLPRMMNVSMGITLKSS